MDLIDKILTFLSDNSLVTIIFVIWAIGSAIKKKKTAKQKPAAHRPASPRARTRPAPAAAAPLAPTSKPRPALRRHPIFSSILEEAEATLAEARGHEATARIVPWIQRGFIEPLEEHALGGWGSRRISEDIQIYWSLLREGLQQRSPAASRTREGRFLLDLETLGGELREKVVRAVGRGRDLSIRHLLPVRVPRDFALSACDLEPIPSTGIAPIPVPESAEREVWRWVLLHHQMGHLLWHLTPGLKTEIARKVGVRTEAVPLLALGFLSRARLVKHLIGIWLPEIFADVFTTLTLGPAAAAGARALYKETDAESLSLIRGMEDHEGMGGFFHDSHPPPHLRLVVITETLSRLQYVEEAKAASSRWRAEHLEPGELLLGLPGGYGRALPLDPFVDAVRSVVGDVLFTRFRSLGGRALGRLEGLPFLRGSHEDVMQAVGEPRPERLQRADSAAWVIAFAAHAHDRGIRQAAQEARKVLSFRARGERIEEGTARSRAAAVASPVATVDLRELMAEAVIWREILLPPVALRGRQGRRER